MSVTIPVVRARWRDIDLIVGLVTDTLAPTARAAWLVPNESHRRPVLAAAARIWVEHALLFGDAFLLRNGTAAAVWLHRFRPIPPPDRYADRLTEACGEYRERFLHLGRILAERRPTEPHNHLVLLATPAAAGPGQAAVLAGAQRRMDTLSLPTYVEAFTATERDLFRRHGYASGDPVVIPGGTAVYPMWRLSPFGIRRPTARWAHRRAVRVGHRAPR